MILLCGIPSESPLQLLQERLSALNLRYLLYNQRHFDHAEMNFQLNSGNPDGTITIDHCSYALGNFTGVYLRLMDDCFLPELKNDGLDSSKRRRCGRFHESLISWCEIAPIRVVNRVSAMASNFSKPYQAQIIREHGFSVPETLITNDPDSVLDFEQRHKKIVYKSISGIRSIVQIFKEKDRDRLNKIRWCPTQFQQYIEGTNVRVHTIGSMIFATAIDTEATDYRYARSEEYSVSLRATQLPPQFQERCLSLAATLKLDFAGIDLKITPRNEVYCFEVNPSPAFSYYQLHTGQEISDCLARYLAGYDS